MLCFTGTTHKNSKELPRYATVRTSRSNSTTTRRPGMSSFRLPHLKNKRNLQIGVLVIATIILVVAVHAYAPDIQPAQIAKSLRDAGSVGFFLYIGGFLAGELLHIPGIVFIAAGVMVYGKWKGWLLAVITAPLSCVVSFVVVRWLGGQPLSEVSSHWMKQIMSNLEDRPLRTVFILRLVTFLAPGANYALALTSISFKDFLIASAAGLFIPITCVVILLEKVMEAFGYEVHQPET